MKRQQSLDTYFRVKANPGVEILKTSENLKNKPVMTKEKMVKKRSLSIQRINTPIKSPKTATLRGIHSEIKDENSPDSDLSLSGSDTTLLYSPPTVVKTPTKLGTPKSGSRSGNKIFSPERNRLVYKRSPKKAVRNLTSELNKADSQEDEVLSKACEGFNDSTIFLLRIIHKFLKTESLKKLLAEPEQQLLSKTFQVLKPGMLLVCRLYWHQDRWQRWQKLNKITESIGQVDTVHMYQVVDSLIKCGFIIKADNQANKMTFDDLVDVLKHEELKKIGKDLLKKNFKTKYQAVEALRKFSKITVNMNMFIKGSCFNNMSRLLKIMSEAVGNCYRLSEFARNTLYKLYLISFLGMDYSIIREKNLELLLLHDKLNRETYPIDKSMELDDASVVFRNRDDFNKFLTAHYMYEDFLKLTDTTDKCKLIEQVYENYKKISEEDMKSYKSLPTWLRMFTPANIYIKILSTGVQDLKRLKSETKYRLCVDILNMMIEQNAFRQHKKADWYAEKALILFTLQDYDEAAQVLLDGFNSSMPSESKDILRARAKKIANQKNITVSDCLRQRLLIEATKDDMLEKNLRGTHIFKNRVEKSSARGKVKFITKTGDGLMEEDAELCCITHYVNVTGEYTHGEHWEGRIVNTIFFLLFWDIIYHRLHGYKGIYLSYFQKYPLDMFTDSFYLNRKTLIEDRLKEIESWSEEQLIDFMHETYTSRPETELSLVTCLEWPSIRDVVSCLGPTATSALCRPLATNYRRKHSGFPDLTLWNVNNKKIKFVEVKTDTDKPSMKQIQWMHYLCKNNIDTEFCYIGTNTTRSKARSEIKTKKDTVNESSSKKPCDSTPKIKDPSNTSLLIASDDSDNFDTSINIATNSKTKIAPEKPRKKAAGPKRRKKTEAEIGEHVNNCKINVKKETDVGNKETDVDNKEAHVDYKETYVGNKETDLGNKETDVDNKQEKSKSLCHIVFEDDLDEDLSLLLEDTETIIIE